MIFTNTTRVMRSEKAPLPPVPTPTSTFSYKYRTAIENVPPPVLPESVIDRPRPKKKTMKWGEPTWFMFHTLAEKVKPEYFEEIRVELLQIISLVCSNLPCPDCAKHATQYMAKLNPQSIQTKEHLRIFFHRFHNDVNKKKGLPEFPLDAVTPKYSSANTVNIIHYFMIHFEDKNASFRLIADGLQRSRICSQLRAWFSKNIGFFEL